MPWTYRKPIKLNLQTTNNNSLKNTVDYIANPEKTLLLLQDDNSQPVSFSSLEGVIQYATNENKTLKNSKSYIQGFNCNAITASSEMVENLKKYGEWSEESRIAYHNIISFPPDSPITNDELMAFGIEFCKRFYSGFQCVIACHINETQDGRGKQPHLHIVNCAIDKEGRRMRDDLYTSPTSLSNMRNISDALALEMGFPIIDTVKSGQVHGQNLGYIKSLVPSQTQTIEQLIDKFKPLSTDIETLLENIQLETGCEIKRTNKNIAIRLPSSKKFKRLSSLSMGYTEKDLNRYFYNRLHSSLPKELEGCMTDERSRLLIESIRQPETRIDPNVHYEKWEYARLKTKQNLERLRAMKQYLDENSVYSQKDFLNLIAKTNTEVTVSEQSYKRSKDELCEKLNELNRIRCYFQTNENEEIHKKLEKELGNDTEALKSRYTELRGETASLQKELFQLSQAKEKAKMNYDLLQFYRTYTGQTEVQSFSFSRNQILSQDEKQTVIQVPYLKDKFVSINTEQISIDRYGRYLYFIAPEEPFVVKDLHSTIDQDLNDLKLTSTLSHAKVTLPESCIQNGLVRIPFTDTLIQYMPVKNEIELLFDNTSYHCVNAKTGNEYTTTGVELFRQFQLAKKFVEEPETTMTGEELLNTISRAKTGMQDIKREDNNCFISVNEDTITIVLEPSMVDTEYSTDEVVRVRLPFSTYEVDIPRDKVNDNSIELDTKGKDYWLVSSNHKIWKQSESSITEKILTEYRKQKTKESEDKEYV